ncbi:hypothetical protein JI747_003665 [Chryseobacterium sp. RG1]|uniref:Uncharacterized protein n=1 Tax=Chryseobacterium tagetis TaxID=2801334 RepID=A0ABS7ZX04_9FLAO|nr:hypothetical protein [Chryseobacterium tagetis]MCA6066262.1 hypothetical protein [Chryseobacterium tagetis]
MKLLLVPIIFASISLSAQSTEKKVPSLKLKKDTLNMKIVDSSTTKKAKRKNMYTMLIVKPENLEMYACLKDKRIDTTEYKILNSTPPGKLKLLSKKK